MKTEVIKRFEMVDYDPVKDEALFSYYTKTGIRKEIWQHRQTFATLFKDSRIWRNLYRAPMTGDQEDLVQVAKITIPGNPEKWFSETSNQILKERANG